MYIASLSLKHKIQVEFDGKNSFHANAQAIKKIKSRRKEATEGRVLSLSTTCDVASQMPAP